jgi:osmoprotectant transport system substrate-binding protein
MKRTRIVLVLTAAVTMIGATACSSGSNNPLAAGTASGGGGNGTIVVGSANFPESALLADIYAGALSAKGVKVEERLNIGSRETYIPALKDGSIDLIPEYTGVLDQYFNKNAKATSPNAVYAELKAHLPSTMTILDKSAAQDKDSVVVTKKTATRLKLTSIGDLEPYAKDLTLGGPPEWQTRMTGVPGLKKLYNLTFKAFMPLDTGGPLCVQALKNGQVDAVDIFSTDPSIAANGFVVLSDPKNLIAAQNVVPLMTKSKLTPTISNTLNAVSAKLDTATLGELDREVVTDQKDESAVAQEFLTKNGLG